MVKASDRLNKLSKAVGNINPKEFDFLVEEIPRIIRVRTRLGKGLLGKLKPLSDKYMSQRKKMNLSGETTVKRSNLTQTGEMLDSIVGKRRGNIFTFFFKNAFSDSKARWADELGRPFFDLLPSEEKGLRRKISAIMRAAIIKTFD